LSEGKNGAKSYMKGDYENMPAGRDEEDKANSKPNQLYFERSYDFSA
jgi:hypothetical protein